MEYHRQISKGEREYIKMWQRESKKWERFGLFQRAASFLDPKGNGIHVDIGSGSGFMLEALRCKYPDLKLVGIERYQSLLDLARVNLKKAGINSVILDESTAGMPGDNGFGARVTLIKDNIQSLDILKDMLNGRQISSASFMFPGITKISAMQKVEKRKELELLRLMAELRHKVYRCLSEIVMPGGRMVLAEKTTPRSLDDEITGRMISLMGGCEEYWEFGERDLLIGVDDEITGVKRIDTLAGKIPERDEELTFFIQSFRRNIVKYGDEHSELDDHQKTNANRWRRMISGIFSDK